MERVINCSILTPEREIFNGDVQFAVVQAHDGEMGFLYNHTSLIAELGIGEIRLNNKNSVSYYVVEGGLVEIRDNKLVVLAETAVRKEDLNAEEVKSKLNELKSKEVQVFSLEAELIKIEERKIKARLKVISR